jgi:hypothetical protein
MLPTVFLFTSKVIFLLVGLVTFGLGIKFLTSKSFFPYHSQAVKKEWSEIDPPLQILILALMRMIGLGTTSLSLLLVLFTLFGITNHPLAQSLFIPGIVFFYWVGVVIVTRWVHRSSGATTPWRESISIACLCALGVSLLLFT